MSVLPMSEIARNECCAGSNISTTGDRSSGATTAFTGRLEASCVIWSVSAVASSTDGSV